MQSVTESPGRKHACICQQARQVPSFRGHRYGRNTPKPVNTLTRHTWITPRRLIERHSGNHQIEVLRCCVPPAASHILVGSDGRI